MYEIFVKTQQQRILIYKVDKYEITEGGFVKFFDKKEQKIKYYHSVWVEINEVN